MNQVCSAGSVAVCFADCPAFAVNSGLGPADLFCFAADGAGFGLPFAVDSAGFGSPLVVDTAGSGLLLAVGSAGFDLSLVVDTAGSGLPFAVDFGLRGL